MFASKKGWLQFLFYFFFTISSLTALKSLQLGTPMVLFSMDEFSLHVIYTVGDFLFFITHPFGYCKADIACAIAPKAAKQNK